MKFGQSDYIEIKTDEAWKAKIKAFNALRDENDSLFDIKQTNENNSPFQYIVEKWGSIVDNWSKGEADSKPAEIIPKLGSSPEKNSTLGHKLTVEGIKELTGAGTGGMPILERSPIESKTIGFNESSMNGDEYRERLNSRDWQKAISLYNKIQYYDKYYNEYYNTHYHPAGITTMRIPWGKETSLNTDSSSSEKCFLEIDMLAQQKKNKENLAQAEQLVSDIDGSKKGQESLKLLELEIIAAEFEEHISQIVKDPINEMPRRTTKPKRAEQ